MRLYIPEDMVFDGYLGEPHGGKALTGLGVKLVSIREGYRGQVDEDQMRHIELSGLVQWSRIGRVDHLMETEIEVEGVRLLTQEYSFDGVPAEIGTTHTVSGVPLGVRDYEYEDFEIPDVRRDWTVDAVGRWENFFMVDLRPVEFRFNN